MRHVLLFRGLLPGGDGDAHIREKKPLLPTAVAHHNKSFYEAPGAKIEGNTVQKLPGASPLDYSHMG